jgi:hypothetical protein
MDRPSREISRIGGAALVGRKIDQEAARPQHPGKCLRREEMAPGASGAQQDHPPGHAPSVAKPPCLS